MLKNRVVGGDAAKVRFIYKEDVPELFGQVLTTRTAIKGVYNLRVDGHYAIGSSTKPALEIDDENRLHLFLHGGNDKANDRQFRYLFHNIEERDQAVNAFIKLIDSVNN